MIDINSIADKIINLKHIPERQIRATENEITLALVIPGPNKEATPIIDWSLEDFAICDIKLEYIVKIINANAMDKIKKNGG